MDVIALKDLVMHLLVLGIVPRINTTSPET